MVGASSITHYFIAPAPWREPLLQATLRCRLRANFHPMTRLCSECGEPIDEKRLVAIPATRLCLECANIAGGPGAIAPPKAIDAKPMATTFHLKRYLKNVGQKTDAKSLLRTLTRVNYLFPHVSSAEMTSLFIQWSKLTNSPFDHEQIRELVLEARQRVQRRDPNRRT